MDGVSWARSLPRRRSYPLLGALLATGAPAGLFLLRCVLGLASPSFAGAFEQLRGDLPTYTYALTSTTIVFALLGRYLGALEDSLERASATDALTGLANRRHFQERLEEEVGLAARHGTPFSLLLIDVDGLKKINDRGGHDAGDAALRAVARSLRETCRRTDTAARVGGDEFGVLAPMTASAPALELANRIRGALRQVVGDAPPTISVGIADFESTPAREPHAIYAAADAALYAAKAAGRDRAVLAGRPG